MTTHEPLHEVRSPYTGQAVGTAPLAGPEETRAALERAQRAMDEGLAQHRRAEILERMAQLIAQEGEELATTISAEAGKPITLARIEAERAVGTFQAAALAARQLAGEQVAIEGWAAGAGRLAYTSRHPVGIVGAITPFNFPLNLVSHKVAPAIAAGCAIVLKPADKTPLSALTLADIASRAGLPEGWLNVVVGDAPTIAGVMCDDPRMRLLTFTGSSAVGQQLKERAVHARVMLELGNATPVIVDRDADLDLVTSSIVGPAFGFAGQTCVSPQRLLVQHEVVGELRERVASAIAGLGVGDPADTSVTVGPLITTAAHDRVLDWIREALDGGAELVTGGESRGRNVIAPTLLAGVEPHMKVGCAEVFGPVLAMMSFATLDEAIEVANGTPYGLQAAIFTRSLDGAMRAAERLRFGSVMVNESPSFRVDHMPYGGTKDSGNTKEGPAYAVHEMTEARLVVIARPGRT